MNTKKLPERVNQLETDIKESINGLLNDFNRETGLNIGKINVRMLEDVVNGDAIIYPKQVDVTLNLDWSFVDSEEFADVS